MSSIRSWKTKRRQELGFSVTNLCTFSYCHFERLSPHWRELIIYVCMSVGVPSPKPVWTGTVKRLCKEIKRLLVVRLWRINVKFRHWPAPNRAQRKGRRRNWMMFIGWKIHDPTIGRHIIILNKDNNNMTSLPTERKSLILTKLLWISQWIWCCFLSLSLPWK